MASYKLIENNDGSITYHHQEKFFLDSGEYLDEFHITYEAHGNPKKPIIIVNHALSSSFHIKSDAINSVQGWWEEKVGPGKCLDTDKYFIICIGNLGSYKNCSNPMSTNPKTGETYKLDFPHISVNDIAKSQIMLLKALDITEIFAIIGNSMGAYISLTLAIHLEKKVNKLISISSSYKAYPNTRAIHQIQKEIITQDEHWNNGNYSREIKSMKIARKLGLIAYFSPAYINERFNEKNSFESYLEYNSLKFCSYFDANTYIKNLETMDTFNIDRYFPSTAEAFKRIFASCLIISVNSDVLINPSQQREMYETMKLHGVKVKLSMLESKLGHDAFYKDIEIEKSVRYHLSN
ncbi:MAG: alpha/beta fold hydrolase [Pseudomonadota bacterium]|nr:alpha/beta fold hydrolase [Pseudomonadota bacterium]